MNDAPIVIAGGSGFLGSALAAHLLSAGRKVVVLSRKASPLAGVTNVAWDARSDGDWFAALDGAAAVVNLAGRTVDCIKTPDHCDEILRSRVEATRALGRAMRAVANPPATWVQMSTAHIYGDPPVARCDESAATGYGLAPTVGRAWEEAFRESVLPTQRGVVLRTSFVIGRDRGSGGGALSRLRFLAKFGLGGRVGAGTQGMSWIHEADICAIFEAAINDPTFDGVYNVTGPNPVSQVEFMRSLRRAIGMPIGLPATEWMVRIGAPLVMRTDPELALYGRYIVPKRLIDRGFAFRFPTLDDALRDLV